jgi:predicted dehydrogenase
MQLLVRCARIVFAFCHRNVAVVVKSEGVVGHAEKIKLGVFGAGRGDYQVASAEHNGFELTAICDRSEPLLRRAKRSTPVATSRYTAFTTNFLRMILLAVIVPITLRITPSLDQGLGRRVAVYERVHVDVHDGGGRRLVEAVERSGKVYFFAENYPFMRQNLEMARLFQSGDLGRFLYGEGEYIHPATVDQRVQLMTGPEHWRSWLPVTYYCTHSMGPVMLITGTMPVQVNGLIVSPRLRRCPPEWWAQSGGRLHEHSHVARWTTVPWPRSCPAPN